MISSVTLCHTHRHRVRHDPVVRFEPGLNAIIGPNGTGKSTILRVIQQCPHCTLAGDETTRTLLFDSESANPQASGFARKNQLDTILQTRGLFSSHGEIMRDVLATLPVGAGDLLLLDEPEAGQDASWAERLRGGLLDLHREIGVQIIMATHHPLLWYESNIIELAPGYEERTRALFRRYL
ncbi:MAG: ABC transporter ATP-binding protein [Alkalispirochaetaceae bacterium]